VPHLWHMLLPAMGVGGGMVGGGGGRWRRVGEVICGEEEKGGEERGMRLWEWEKVLCCAQCAMCSGSCLRLERKRKGLGVESLSPDRLRLCGNDGRRKSGSSIKIELELNVSNQHEIRACKVE